MTFDVAKCMVRSRTSEELKSDIESVNQCINPLSLYNTADLVRELCSRDGVESHGISESYGVSIVHEIECLEPVNVSGPAKIIVVLGRSDD